MAAATDRHDLDHGHHPGIRTAALAGLAPLALLFAHAAPASALTPPGRLVFPALARLPAAGTVALTFDDGPDRSCEAFLAALERAGARATFFLVGEQVERAPALAAEILAAGHEVGVHGYRHRSHLLLTPRQVADDLARAQAVIEEATGRPARLFRPPYGVFSLATWRAAGRHGWERVLWRRWGRDWRADATPGAIVDTIGRPEAGDIILLHDSDRYSAPGSWRNTLAALPLLFERLAAAGLAPRAVGDLLDGAACSA